MPQIRYTPNAGFIGADSVQYRVTNPDGGTHVGTVDLTVQAPAAGADVDFSAITPVGSAVVGYWRHETDDEVFAGVEYYEVALANSATARVEGKVVALSDGLPASTLRQGNDILYYSGLNPSEPIVGVQFNGLTYITSRNFDSAIIEGGTSSPWSWRPDAPNPDMKHVDLQVAGQDDGGTSFGWSDTGASQANTPHFPAGLASATWDNRVWVANTSENGELFPNRLRYSVNGSAVNWNELDYIDVDVGEDGDEIRALVVYGEGLLVLKRRSMYLILPESDTQVPFSLVPVASGVGCEGPYAATSSPIGAWFWDEGTGLNIWTGRDPQNASTAIYRDIEDGIISSSDPVHVGWDDQRVWCGVQRNGELVNFIYSPLLQVGGSWTLSTPGVLAPLPYVNFEGTRSAAYMPKLGRWVTVDNPLELDNHGAGEVAVASHWCTPWLNGGRFFGRKRWRRPQFLGGSEGEAADVTVEVMKDYVDAPEASFTAELAATASAKAASVERGVSLGEAEAVLLRLQGPKTDSRWRLDRLALQFIDRPWRG